MNEKMKMGHSSGLVWFGLAWFGLVPVWAFDRSINQKIRFPWLWFVHLVPPLSAGAVEITSHICPWAERKESEGEGDRERETVQKWAGWLECWVLGC